MAGKGERGLDKLIILLLALNLLGVLFISVKVSLQKKTDSQQEVNQKLIENMIIIKREMADLKSFIDQHTRLFQIEMARFRAEREEAVAAPKIQEVDRQNEHLLLNDRYKDVFDLQQQGLSISDIAKKLDKGYTEIEMILQLAGKRE